MEQLQIFAICAILAVPVGGMIYHAIKSRDIPLLFICGLLIVAIMILGGGMLSWLGGN